MTSTHRTATALRLFVALPVPAAVSISLATSLDRCLPDASDLRRARPEGWHITLAFLGDTPAARLPDVVDVVTSFLARRPLPDRIRLGSPGRFGDHTLWVGVDDRPAGSIGRFGADLQEALFNADLPVTQRELTPHITVARARRRGRVAARDVHALEPIPPASWQPDGVEVWRAHFGQGPARYSAEASVSRKDTGHQNGAADSGVAT